MSKSRATASFRRGDEKVMRNASLAAHGAAPQL
jgi:hypothetical protein